MGMIHVHGNAQDLLDELRRQTKRILDLYEENQRLLHRLKALESLINKKGWSVR